MKFRPIILFPVAAVLIALIYALGETRTKSSAKKKPAEQVSANTPHQHDDTKSFEYVLNRATSQLETSQADSVKALTQEVEVAKNKYDAYKRLGSYWMRTGSIITAGYYHSLAADANPDDKEQRLLSARMFAMGINGAADSVAKDFASHQAVKNYEKLIALDSSDLQSKIELALVYVESNQVMQGVMLLRDVEKVEPDNETVNLTLGRLAVVSGQFDKAIARLEKLVKQHPENAEAYIHLAEAYRATGQKEKAITTLENCKKVVNDSPEAVQQVEQIINSIKKS